MPVQACACACARVSACTLLGSSSRSCICTRVCQHVNICANICITARGCNCLGISEMHGGIWSLAPEAGVMAEREQAGSLSYVPGHCQHARNAQGTGPACHRAGRAALLRYHEMRPSHKEFQILDPVNMSPSMA